uniref:Uncharacterized protein n=1 Tax=Glossina palpalis gambiensis TaxID=67801 RepID=A0A1B0BU70_9MUSC
MVHKLSIEKNERDQTAGTAQQYKVWKPASKSISKILKMITMDPANIPESGESKIDEAQSDDINDEIIVEELKNYCVDRSRSTEDIEIFLDNYEKSPNEQQCLQQEHKQLAIPTDQCLSSDHDLAAGYETLLGVTNHVESLIEEIQEQAMKNKHLNDLQRRYEDLFNQKIALLVERDIKCNEEQNLKTNTANDEVGNFQANPKKNVEKVEENDDKCLKPVETGFEEQRNLLKVQVEEEVKQKILELDENHCELESKYNEEKKILEQESTKQFSDISFSEDDENLYSQRSELRPQLNEEGNQEFEENNLFKVFCLVAQERDELKQKLSDSSKENDLMTQDLEKKLSETAEEFRLVAQERDELKQKFCDLSNLLAQETDDLKQKLSDLSEENDSKPHDLETKLSETTEEFRLVVQERNELDEKLSDLSEENDLKAHDLETKLSKITEELRLVAQERNELKEKLCDLSVENENLQDRNNYLNCRQQNEETLLRNKIKRLNDNLQEVRSKVNQNVRELEQYRNMKESEVKNLKQNIENLSANMIALGTHDLEAKLSKTTEEFRLVAQERDVLKQKLWDLSEKNDLKALDLEAKLSEKIEEFHLVAQERDELKQKLCGLSEENGLKVRDLEAKLSATAEEFRLVVQKRDELKQKLWDLSEENEKLRDRNIYINGYNCGQQEILRNKISLISDNLQQVQSKLDENVKELEQYRNLKESEVKSLKQNIANLTANMITLGVEKGSLQSQKSELKDQLSDIIIKFNFMSEECQKLEDYKCKQDKEQGVLKEQIQNLREEKEKLREYPCQLENLNRQHSTLKEKLRELEEKSLEETSMLKERFISLQQEKYAIEKKFFKRLQNEQDRYRKQLKLCNQRYCYQMMKAERSIAAAMQFIKMHSKTDEWSAPVTEIIKLLEARAMQIVKPADLINMQSDRDFNVHLQRLEVKCNELKTICHLHYEGRKEKGRKKNLIKNEISDYDSGDQNVSKADQIRSLKEQCKALNKELKFVKTKYQITRVAMQNAH